MSLDETVLAAAVKDGSLDCEKWPGLLDPLLERLEHIVHNEFPLPQLPQNSYESVPTVLLESPSRVQELNSQTNSNKENAPPSQLQSPPRPPPVPLFSSPASVERVPDSQPLSGPADEGLPPPLVSLLSSVKSTLKTNFSNKPPHTIQRLAELVLHPTAHYRTLPAYLRAVDRVVSVSSPTDIFPLPRTTPLPGTNLDGTPMEGVNGIVPNSFMFSDAALGSDESLGGALLTPIPWLNNSLGEEDGDVFAEPDEGTIAASAGHTGTEAGATTTTAEPHESEGAEEIPHARGPPVLGVEDLGLQDGKGVEMTLDIKPDEPAAASSGGDDGPRDQPDPADPDADADGDVVISDVVIEKKEPEPESSQGSASEGG